MEKKKLKIDEKGIGTRLPKELQRKISAEKNPQEIIEKALTRYYSDSHLRNENAAQKEIDNNIIEIQRRHISDLKEQLSASNKNYEELMKTYQAYMFQVQPLIERAQLLEKAEIKTLEEKKEKGETAKAEKETAPQSEIKTASQTAAAAQPATAQPAAAQPAAAQTAPPSTTPDMPFNEIKTKKWYEFWK